MAALAPSLADRGAADPQGGRYHLLAGTADWRACHEHVEPAELGSPLVEAPPVFEPDDGAGRASSFEWDPRTGSLRLAHREAVGRHPVAAGVRRPQERRGADRDRFGTWYWVTADRRAVVRLAPRAPAAVAWWSVDDVGASCADGAPGAYGGFAPVAPVLAGAPASTRLGGLAVTTDHHLVVGLVDDVGGLLAFDLHAGGGPLVLRWPGDRVVAPFDLAATADGGLLVLDRVRRTWWRLDRTFRLRATVTPGVAGPFVPADGTAPTANADEVDPVGHVLPANGPRAAVDPVAISDGPGVVPVLDRPAAGPSAVLVCDPRQPGGVTARLPVTVEALDPARPDLPVFVHDVVGHDLAWSAVARRPLDGPLLYVADASTGGTEAYALELDGPRLVHQPEELPMRSWEAKALVATADDVFYDAVGRWVPLEPFGVCNLVLGATLRTPAPVAGGPLGQPFDSAVRGCVWHRLFVDAELPSGCTLTVGARAADDLALLDRLPFGPQPSPYLRGAGSELPWHDPWAGVTRPASASTGTWELLFQHVTGRYLQLELRLQGTGRTTPALRALRAWYPRFSYVQAYLPDVYQEEDEPARFLERMLANFEGHLTDHEVRIERAWMLVDPRTAPVEALDWLASWVGLQLEPAWTTARRRFLLRHVDLLYRRRGTVGGLRSLLRLYLGCSLDPDVVFAGGPRPDDPARVVDHLGPHRFRVVIPAHLGPDDTAMVERIVAAARPAHASFELRIASGLLVVGEAQVGIDTVLGAGSRFEPIVLDRTTIAAGILGAVHPFDVADRIVADRDRLGELPAL